MRFEGSFNVSSDQENVFDFVTSPEKISTILPDLQEFGKLDENSFNAKVKVGLAYIKGTMSMNFRIEEKKRPEFARIIGKGTGMQSTVELSMSIKLVKLSDGTRIEWVSDANVGGMLASFGSRIINSVAEKYIKQITESLRQKLS